jgi:NAD(P)-dependent dehydrogenase (short-subunit alcohol dehydrogenase family)
MMSPIQMIVERAFREFGKIDILVNNAGVIRRTPAIEFSEKDWDEVMAINSKTVFFFSQAVAKDMINRNTERSSTFPRFSRFREEFLSHRMRRAKEQLHK